MKISVCVSTPYIVSPLKAVGSDARHNLDFFFYLQFQITIDGTVGMLFHKLTALYKLLSYEHGCTQDKTAGHHSCKLHNSCINRHEAAGLSFYANDSFYIAQESSFRM